MSYDGYAGDKAERARAKYEELRKEGEALLSELKDKLSQQPLMFGDDIAKEGRLRFREDDGELARRRKAIDAIVPTDLEKSLEDLSRERGGNLRLDRETLHDIYERIGEVQNKRDGQKVQFYKGILKKLPNEEGLFYKAIPALKDAFENSVLAFSEEENLHGKEREKGGSHKDHPNIEAYHHYVGKVRMEGKEYYVRFTVTEEKSSRKQGLHSAFVTNVDLYEKNNKASNEPTLPQTLRGKETKKAVDFDKVSDAKLREFFERTRKAEENIAKESDGTVSDSAATVAGKDEAAGGAEEKEPQGKRTDKPGSAGEGQGTTARNTRIPRIRGGERVADRIYRAIAGRLGVSEAEGRSESPGRPAANRHNAQRLTSRAGSGYLSRRLLSRGRNAST